MQGEGYSSLKGFFRQYELVYVVADERDVIRVRTNYRKDQPEDVYLYRVQAPIENTRRLFLDYVRAINALYEHPHFYNTLTTNCTTNILYHTRVNPATIPLSWRVLLSGYAAEYAYANGARESPYKMVMGRWPTLHDENRVSFARAARPDTSSGFGTASPRTRAVR